MRRYFKPSQQFTALGACVFCHFLLNPLRNANFLHTQRVGNDICVIAYPVNHRFCAKLFQFIAGKFLARITMGYMMACSTIQKTMISAIFASLTHKIRETAMAFIGKGWTCPTKQTADRSALFVRHSFHQSSTLSFIYLPNRLLRCNRSMRFCSITYSHSLPSGIF